MELKEFVRDVLIQIAEGVRDSDKAVTAAGGTASPATRFAPVATARDTHFATLENGAPVFLVDFDVAVTVSDTSTKDLGAGLHIASFLSVGAEGKLAESMGSVSRVRFKVPIALPVNADSSAKVQAHNKKATEKLQYPKGSNFARDW